MQNFTTAEEHSQQLCKRPSVVARMQFSKNKEVRAIRLRTGFKKKCNTGFCAMVLTVQLN